MVRLRSLAPALFGPLLVGAVSCSRPTEIVVRLDTVGAAPASITVKLHRSEPFPADVPSTPSYVVAALDGADLDLIVTPQGNETSLSLLPPKSGAMDVRITVEPPGPGYTVSPAGGQNLAFVDGDSQSLSFTITAPVPDMGAPDAGSRDGGKADGGKVDAAAPMDASPGN